MKTNPASPKPLLPAILIMMVASSTVGAAQDAVDRPSDAAVSAKALQSVQAPANGSVPAPGGTSGLSGSTPDPLEFPGKTVLDDPGNQDPRLLVPVDAEGKVSVARLSKIDLDADLDYDGTLNNDSSSDQGQHEAVPPGLELGVAEVTRLLVRFKTYEESFTGSLVVGLEVSGINRDSASGAFASGGDESLGRIRVWRDQARRELLLDSGDPAKRRYEWRYDPEKRFGGIPRTLYLEGVELSPKFEGDLRLLLTATHKAEGAVGEEVSSLYRGAFDHLLVTVRKEPVEKEFFNNNVEGVWSMVGDAPLAAAEGGDDSAKEGSESKPEAR